MSFSADVKNEITRLDEDKKCCMLAEIAGLIRMCGIVGKNVNNEYELKIITENPAIARLYLKRIKKYFGVGARLNIGQSNVLKKNRFYELEIGAESNVGRILTETGMLETKENGDSLPDGIPFDIIKDRCCKKAFLRGAFLGAGTISHPEKSYHMEIVCRNETLSDNIKRLINSFGMSSKVTLRRKNYVVYLKESEQISDFLALLGASKHVMELENIKIVKELRNKTNRIVNCESANLDKTINSAARQIETIRFIQSETGLDNLPDRLKEIALLRLDHPESSLTELGQMLQPQLKKSGVNHRFRKIEEIADKLR
ncbi:MAG TPA: DNA-binding protein WhiA [Anaerovoracaceae bacterium]|nr:DNA-binding protein WhiA [Anaerovoracaceae bacterium]